MSERKDDIKKVIAQKDEIIKLKRQNVKHSPVSVIAPTPIKNEELADKGVLPKDKEDIIYRKIIANTYNWLDSHSDVHVKGIFAKSIKENKPFLLHDHKFETTAKIGEILSSYEKQVMWKDVGLPKEGSTYALIQDAAISKERNASIFMDYKNGEIRQHSVGMQYVKVSLAADDIDMDEEYKLYTKMLPQLGNPEAAEKQGYFFVVSEAKLIETSAVLLGSNVLTGIYDSNNKSQSLEEIIKANVQDVADIEKIYNICKELNDTYNVEPSNNDTQAKHKPSFFELIAKH